MKSILNYQFLDDKSMGASFNSDPQKVYKTQGFNVQLVFTGSPVGTVKLQSCNALTYDPAEADLATWDDIPDSDQSISASGSHSWTVADSYKWVRVSYTRTSGTGTCDGTLFAIEDF